MNPETNRFEPLTEITDKEAHEYSEQLKASFTQELHREMAKSALARKLEKKTRLLRPDGTPVPEHWKVYSVGELVEVKGYTFKVAYIGESTLLLEPVAPVVLTSEK